jgi:hypothetical protein
MFRWLDQYKYIVLNEKGGMSRNNFVVVEPYEEIKQIEILANCLCSLPFYLVDLCGIFFPPP